MSEILYVVTAGSFSDYHIEAIFKNKSKAELYCACHEDCGIEEYSFSDDNVFTPFESVVIKFRIYKEERKDQINFRFRHLAKEDAEGYLKNEEAVDVYRDGSISIYLWRKLPNNYDEDKIRKKYTKVYQDLRAELLYFVSESDYSTFEKMKEVKNNLTKYIEGRFGIETDDEGDINV